MADISFSMSADEKDVTRALQNLIKENAKLRGEISKGVDESKAAAKQEQAWQQLREKSAADASKQMAQMNSAAQKIRESLSTPYEEAKKKVDELRKHLEAGTLTTEEYRKAYAAVGKELKEATRNHEAEAKAARDVAEAEKTVAAAMRAGLQVTQQYATAQEQVASETQRLTKLRDAGAISATTYDRAIAELNRDLQAEAAAAAQVATAEANSAKTLRDVGAAYGRVSDQVQELSSLAKAAGVSEVQISKQRLAALAPIAAKQEEIRREAEQLKAQLAAGTISADEYAAATQRLNAKSTDLATSLNKLQTELKEDAADIRKAGTAMQSAETATDRYKRKVMELDQQKAKGIITSQQHAKAVAAEGEKIDAAGKSAGAGGDMFAALGTKVAAAAAGFVSMSAVIATLKSEYDALLERQGKSKDANISLATEQEALLMNLGDAKAADVGAQIRDLSKQSGVKEENITRAVNEAMAARADLSVEDVIKGVQTASKVRKFAPSEMAGLAGATIDTQKQTGLGTDESLGFLMQLQAQSRTKSLKGVAENFTPAVGGIMNFGADRQTAGALLASLSHGMGDVTGEKSKTAGLSLAAQLREFGGGQDIGKTIADLQSNAESRQKFLSEGNFEVAARPAIESLLGGGKQAEQFASAKRELAKDPLETLNKSLEDRQKMSSIGLAETDQRMANVVDQQRLSDRVGAESSIARERKQEFRDQSGQLQVFGAKGIIEDVATGGNQTAEQSLKTMQMELKARRRAERLAETNASGFAGYGIAGSLGSIQQPTAESKRETNELAELIELTKQSLQVQRDAANANANKAHAGVVVNRRNNQGEAAP